MQPKHFTLERLLRASASSRVTDDRTILRLDREALKSDQPKIRFATQA